MSNEETIFVQGVWIEEKQSQYGSFTKFSIDVDAFMQFASQHATSSEKNGKKYLNFDMFKSQQTGKPFAKLNTFKPQGQAPQAPQQFQQPQQQPFQQGAPIPQEFQQVAQQPQQFQQPQQQPQVGF